MDNDRLPERLDEADLLDANPVSRTQPADQRRLGGMLLGIGTLLILVAAIALGSWRSYVQYRAALASAQQRHDFVPSLRAASIKSSDDVVLVTLPATTSAFEAANIIARASGYIDKRNVDIGDHVKQGQLLAEIAAPELDHQIAQAEGTLVQLQAALQQATANSVLAQVTWNRDRPLVEQGWVTKQQGTVDVQTLRAQQARSASLRAMSRRSKRSSWSSSSRRRISRSSRHSTGSSPSATSMSGAWSRRTLWEAPSCSRSSKAT
jgi:multidrug efflux pump subunit AcrA (membrane-fusion protein)